MNGFMVRHGDLLLETVETIPWGAKEKHSPVLLDGEVTGHAHRLDYSVDGKTASVYEDERGTIYVSVAAPTPLTHEEHDTIVIPIGTYKMTRQREYNPYERAVRNVQD